MTHHPEAVERVARIVAEGIGYDYDTLYESKREWTDDRGVRHDINTPYKSDMRAAAEAVIAHFSPSPEHEGVAKRLEAVKGWRPIETRPHGDFLAINAKGDVRRVWRHHPSNRTDEILTFTNNGKFAAVGWMPLPPEEPPAGIVDGGRG